MKTFQADMVFEMAVILTNLGNTDLKGDFSDVHRERLITELNNHLRVLKHGELAVSSKHVEDMIANIQEKVFSDYETLAEQVETLKTIVDLELESTLCLRIDANKTDFYQNAKGFGEQVANNFPSAAFDIEEAGKCYACNRNTACVMHLARTVEVGLKAVIAGLGISIPTGRQPSWGEVLRDIWTAIGTRNKAADPTWLSQQKAFFENIHADLSSVKNAWRNPSMHADKVYDSERAEDIYNAVKGFMRHLAEHLDESGNFTP